MAKIDKKARLAEIAEKLGMKTKEIRRVMDSPSGTVIVTFDGVAMIDVPDETSDDGSTLMLLAVPKAGNAYELPVFTGAIDDVVLGDLEIDEDDREHALAGGAHADDISRDDDFARMDEPGKDEVASTQSELDALHGRNDDETVDADEVVADKPKRSRR